MKDLSLSFLKGIFSVLICILSLGSIYSIRGLDLHLTGPILLVLACSFVYSGTDWWSLNG